MTQQGDTGVPSVPKEPQTAEGMEVCTDAWAAGVPQLLSHAFGCTFPTAQIHAPVGCWCGREPAYQSQSQPLF